MLGAVMLKSLHGKVIDPTASIVEPDTRMSSCTELPVEPDGEVSANRFGEEMGKKTK